MNKRLMKVGLIALMFTLLVACKGEEAPKTTTTETNEGLEKVTLVLDWSPNTNHTGFYVAKAKGFFQDKGIELEIVQPPEDGAEALTAAGKADFGISFQDSIAPAYALENPLPVTAVAAILQHNTSGIVSLKGEGMDRPKGLEGKTYATWENPVEQAIVKSIVEADGGDFSKLNLVPSTVTDVITALNTDIDAVWIFYGWDGVAIETRDIEMDYLDFKEIDKTFDYYTPILIANNEFLNNNEDLVKDFMEALKLGYEFAIDNPEEAGEILLEAAPELDRDIVMASQNWLKDQYKAEAKVWGEIDPVRWNNFYAWLFENNLIEKEIPEDFGFTNDFLSR